MPNPYLRPILKPFKNTSLRTVLIIPFLVQLGVTVGLVGYLSFRNGQRAVHNLASQLRNELTARIEQHLQGYIQAPYIINRLNAAALREGELDIKTIRGGNQLLQQMKTTPSINAVYCGISTGDFFGMTRKSTENRFSQNVFQSMISNVSTENVMYLYAIDNTGMPSHLVEKLKFYNPRIRPWYQGAIAADRFTWSNVYLDFTSQLPTITASLPVYNRVGNLLIGVCGVDVILSSELRSFLKTLNVGRSGETFIIERTGTLLSSSTDEQLTRKKQDQIVRLKAVDSSNPLIQGTAQYLNQYFGNLNQIRSPQQLDFLMNGERQFVQILPFKDGHGLDWLIVVVVPEADFMGDIYANTYRTVWLCLAALGVATGLGILTSRWISESIERLSNASNKIADASEKTAHEDMGQQVQVEGIRELRSLADAFNSMSRQLQQSFAALDTQKDAFARFFPAEFLGFFNKNDITQLDLGDFINKDMAVMFSDIRSFTSLSEKMTPAETFQFMNAYLRRVSPEIRNHQGIIIKFLGDGLMAVFPQRVDDAVASAIAQLSQIERFNQEREQAGHLPIQLGIGIHTGSVMMGMVGEESRMQGDTLSDTVNLTARLESLTKYYGISMAISGEVLEQLSDPDRYQLRFLDRAVVKGRTEPIAIYEVLDVEPEPIRILKLQTLEAFRQGIEQYDQGNLAAAKHHFQQVLTVNPLDLTAKLYLERIHQLQEEGIPANWTGIWVFTQK